MWFVVPAGTAISTSPVKVSTSAAGTHGEAMPVSSAPAAKHTSPNPITILFILRNLSFI